MYSVLYTVQELHVNIYADFRVKKLKRSIDIEVSKL